MNDLHDWLKEIDAKMVSLTVVEIEAGVNCSCEFCSGPAEVRSADQEPSNGYSGYSVARALTITILVHGVEEILDGRPLATCSWCHAIARRKLGEH